MALPFSSLLMTMQIYQTKKEKILKVIQIVYDIISALFIVFVSVSLIIGSNKGDKGSSEHLEPTIQEVERKTRDNYFSYSGYCLATPEEVLTNNHFYTFAFLPQEHFDTINTNGTTITTTRANVGTGLIKWFQGGISHDDLGYSSVVGLSNISFILTNHATNNNVFIQVWDVTINLNNGQYNKYTIECYYNSVSGVSYGNAMLGVNIVSFGTSTFDVSAFFITPTSTDFGIWITNEHTLGSDYQTGYDIGYGVGYNEGYSDAKDEWYEKGVDDGVDLGYQYAKEPGNPTYNYVYDLGYQSGLIDGAEGIESNAFIAIGQAFSAVSNVFAVEVLPGLPLWVLVFTPLIIAVVIVVVKLIKG